MKNFNFPKVILQTLKIQATTESFLYYYYYYYSFIYSADISWAPGLASCWKYQTKLAASLPLSDTLPLTLQPQASGSSFKPSNLLSLLPSHGIDTSVSSASSFPLLNLVDFYSSLRWQELSGFLNPIALSYYNSSLFVKKCLFF